MAHPRRFPACVHCEAIHPATAPTMTGYANDGELPVYDLKCGHCGEHYLAALLPLPKGTSMSALDEILRLRRRNAKRRRFGYVPGGEKDNNRGPKRIESDRILATISIRPGRVVSALRKRIGPTTRERLEVA